MNTYVLARARTSTSIAMTMAAFTRLTDGILGTRVRRASRGFCASGVIAAFLVETRMPADALASWLDRAADESGDADDRTTFDVLLADDTEMSNEGVVVPSPLLASGAEALRPLLELEPGVRLPFGARIVDAYGAPPELDVAGAIPGFEVRPEPPTAPVTIDPESEPPEWDDAFGWTTETADWVPVTRAWGWHKEVEIKLTVLLDARIPACLHDRPFGDLYQYPMGNAFPTAILVAPTRLEDARALLAAPVEDPDGTFAGAVAELEEESGRLRYRLVRLGMWAWLLALSGGWYVAVAPPLAVLPIAILWAAYVIESPRWSRAS